MQKEIDPISILEKIIKTYHNPTLTNISYKIYRISAGLGFATMPPEISTRYHLKQGLKETATEIEEKMDRIIKNQKAF